MTSIQYPQEFPETREQFEYEYIYYPSLLRVTATKWFQDMNRGLDEKNDTFSKYSDILTASYENTGKLYIIQAVINKDQNGQPPQVIEGNMYYPILFKSYELWTNLGYLIKLIFFDTNIIDNCEQLYRCIDPSEFQEKGEKLMPLITESKEMKMVFEELEKHNNEILKCLK